MCNHRFVSASPDVHKVFKCIRPDHDGANNAIFMEASPGKPVFELTWEGWEQDDDPKGVGYTELSYGDAGNPWWRTQQEVGSGGTSVGVPTLVAIQSEPNSNYGYEEDELDMCYQFATKVDEDLVKIIRRKSLILKKENS